MLRKKVKKQYAQDQEADNSAISPNPFFSVVFFFVHLTDFAEDSTN